MPGKQSRTQRLTARRAGPGSTGEGGGSADGGSGRPALVGSASDDPFALHLPRAAPAVQRRVVQRTPASEAMTSPTADGPLARRYGRRWPRLAAGALATRLQTLEGHYRSAGGRFTSAGDPVVVGLGQLVVEAGGGLDLGARARFLDIYLAGHGHVDGAGLFQVDQALAGGVGRHLAELRARMTRLQLSTNTFSAMIAALTAGGQPTHDSLAQVRQWIEWYSDEVVGAKEACFALAQTELEELVRFSGEVPALDAAGFARLRADFRAALTAASRALSTASADFNTAETTRQEGHASHRRLRMDPGGAPEGERDWLPAVIPGIRVRKVPFGGLARDRLQGNQAGWRRGPGGIDTVIIHDGGGTNAGTARTLSQRGFPSHFGVDQDGTIQQSSPMAVGGPHVGRPRTERRAVGVDLAHGPGRSDTTSQIGFLGSMAQTVATLKLVMAQSAMNPVDTRSMVGRRGRSGAPRHSFGLAGHQFISGHADPGDVYMQKLYAYAPLIEVYERTYGPIVVDDNTELERLGRLLEAFTKQTGKDPTLIDQDAYVARMVPAEERFHREARRHRGDDDAAARRRRNRASIRYLMAGSRAFGEQKKEATSQYIVDQVATRGRLELTRIRQVGAGARRHWTGTWSCTVDDLGGQPIAFQFGFDPDDLEGDPVDSEAALRVRAAADRVGPAVDAQLRRRRGGGLGAQRDRVFSAAVDQRAAELRAFLEQHMEEVLR